MTARDGESALRVAVTAITGSRLFRAAQSGPGSMRRSAGSFASVSWTTDVFLCLLSSPGDRLRHPALAEPEDLVAVGAEEDRVPGEQEPSCALALAVHLGERLTAVRADRVQIFTFDGVERSIPHDESSCWRPTREEDPKAVACSSSVARRRNGKSSATTILSFSDPVSLQNSVGVDQSLLLRAGRDIARNGSPSEEPQRSSGTYPLFSVSRRGAPRLPRVNQRVGVGNRKSSLTERDSSRSRKSEGPRALFGRLSP